MRKIEKKVGDKVIRLRNTRLQRIATYKNTQLHSISDITFASSCPLSLRVLFYLSVSSEQLAVSCQSVIGKLEGRILLDDSCHS